MAKQKTKSDRKVVFEPLEPRVLLSADLIPLDTSQLTGVVTEELVIEVDVDQPEETGRYVVEGLEADVNPVGEDESASESTPASAVPMSEEQQAALVQQYWVQQHVSSQRATDAAVNAEEGVVEELEIIIVDSAIEQPEQLLASLEQAYNESRESADTHFSSDTEKNDNELISAAWDFSSIDFSQGGATELTDNVVLLVLSESHSGLDQIDEFINQYSNVAALHVFAHGSSGNLRLGSTSVNSETLSRKQQTLSAWKSSFTNNADILLYGCNVAVAGGKEFVSSLATITGADVAASNNVSGAGGDWLLEVHEGDIEYEVENTTALNNYGFSLEQVNTIEQLEDFTDLEELIRQNIDSLAAIIDRLATAANNVSGLGLSDIGMDSASMEAFVDALQDPAQLVLDLATNDVGVLAANIETQINNLVPESLASVLAVSGVYDSFSQEIVFDIQWSLGVSTSGLISDNGNLSILDDIDAEIANILNSDLLSTFTNSLPTGLSLPDTFDGEYRGDATFTLELALGIDLSAAMTSHDIDPSLLSAEDAYIALNSAQLELTAALENVTVNLGEDTGDNFGIQNAEFIVSQVITADFPALDERGQGSLSEASAVNFSAGNIGFSGSLPISFGFDDIGNLANIGLPVISISGDGAANSSREFSLDFQLADSYRANLVAMLGDLENNLDFSGIDLSIPDFPFDIDSLNLLQPIKDAIGELVNFSELANSVGPYFDLLDSLIIANDFLEADGGGSAGEKSIDYSRAGVADFNSFKLRYADVLARLFPDITWADITDEAAMWAQASISGFDLGAYLQPEVFGSLLENLAVIPEGLDASTITFGELDYSIRNITGAVPTVSGLVQYLQTLMPSFSASESVGPLSITGGYDAAAKEIRFDVNIEFSDVLEDALSSANQEAIQNTINDLLKNIADLEFLQGLGINTDDLSEVDGQLPQLENIPVFDLLANLNLSFNFGLSLQNLIASGVFDVNTDSFVELETLNADFTLLTEDLDASFTLVEDEANSLYLNLLEGTGFSIGGVLAGAFNTSETGQRLTLAELQALIDAEDTSVFTWDVRVPFASELPFNFSGTIGGVNLDAISNLGAPLIRIVDDNLLDNSVDLNIFPSLEIDFVLASDFLDQLVSVFDGAQGEANSGAPSFSLPDAGSLGLPFELSELQLGDTNLAALFDNISSLLDLSTFTDLFKDFGDIYSALQLFNEMESGETESSFLDLTPYENTLARLLSNRSEIDFSADDFNINAINIQSYLSDLNIDAFYREFGDTLNAMFPVELSSLNLLRTGWQNQFGRFPTLKGLGEFVSAAIDRMGAVDFDLGPIEFSAVYDSDATEFRLEVNSNIRESLIGMSVDGIAAAVQDRISDALDSLGGAGVAGLIEAEDFSAWTFPGDFEPLIDAIASLDFSGAFVFDLSDVFLPEGSIGDLGLDDFSFSVSQMDADLSIDVKNLGFDVEWGAGNDVGVSNDAYIRFAVGLSRNSDSSPETRIGIGDLADLFDTGNFDFDIASSLDVFLPLEFSFADFDSENFGIPVLTFSNPDILGGGAFEFDADLLISDNLASSIEDVFNGISSGIKDAANALNLDQISALDSLLGGLFDNIDGIAQLGPWVSDFLQLGQAFNFSPDFSLLGTELNLGADYDDSEAHRSTLISTLNSKFSLDIDVAVGDFDFTHYLPEIFDLLTPGFNLNAYLPTFNILLGLTGGANSSGNSSANSANLAPVSVDESSFPATSFDQIRERVGSLFSNVGSLNGLIDFISALLPSSLSAEEGPFSIDVNFDNYEVVFGLNLSPSVKATLDDAISFFEDAMGSGLGDISELLGLEGDNVNYLEALENIELAAGLNLDLESTIDFSDLFDGDAGTDFVVGEDVSVAVNTFNADFSLSGQNLGFNIQLGDANTSAGVSNGSIDLSVLAEVAPFSVTLGNLVDDFSNVVDPNLSGEFEVNLPIDLTIAGFDLGEFANPVINVSDTINLDEGDLFNPVFTLELGLDVGQFILDPVNELIASIESLGITSTVLPLLDMSLDDLLGIQDYLNNIVSTIENLAPLTATLSYDAEDNVDFSIAQTTLDDVNDVISSVLGFADNPQTIFNLVKDGVDGVDTLEFDLNLGLGIDQIYNIDLNFWDVLASAGIDLSEYGLDVIDISANAEIGVAGSADFGLHFDVNVSEFFEDTERELIELVSNRNASATGFQLNLDTFGVPVLNINAGLDIDRDELPGGALGDIIDTILGLATVQVKEGRIDLLQYVSEGGPALPALSFTYDDSSETWVGDVAVGFTFDAPVYIANSILLTDAISLAGTLSETASGALDGGITLNAADAVSNLRDELSSSADEIINKVKIALLTSNPLFILDELANNFDPGVEGSVFNRLLSDLKWDLGVPDRNEAGEIVAASQNPNPIEIPFLGTTSEGTEKSAGEKIFDAFDNILGDLFGGFIGGMAQQIRDAGLADATLIDLIQEGLYQLLYSAENALIGFLEDTLNVSVAAASEPGALRLFSVVDDGDDLSLAQKYLPVDQDALGEGRIQFELIIATRFMNLDFGIDFSAGVPGFAMEVQDDSNIRFTGDFVLDLGFGFDINARSAGEFLFLATDTGEDGKELIVELEATIVDSDGNERTDFNISGQLGVIQAQVGYNTEEVEDFDTAKLTGQLVFDLQDFDDETTADIDESQDQVVSLGDFSQAFTIYVALNGNLDGRAILGIGLPTDNSFAINWDETYQDLSAMDLIIGGGTDLHLTVNYYKELVGNPQLPNSEGELVPIAELNGTELVFEDVYLDVSFLIGEDSFLYDIISFVNDYIADPYEQITDILFTEIAFLGDIGLVAPDKARIGDQSTTELIDVLKLLADYAVQVPDARVKAAGQAVNAIILLVDIVGNLVDLAETLEDSASGYLNFGSFRLGDEITTAGADWLDNVTELGGDLGSNNEADQYDSDNAALTNKSPNAVGGDAGDKTNLKRPDEGSLGDGEYPESTTYGSGANAVDFDFGFNYSIGIIENPKSIIDILMGKDTDLFSFGFDLEATVGYEVKQNIAGPLLAGLGFDFGLGIDLDIGFNTRGMSDFLSDLFAGNAPSLENAMDGFYFDDHWNEENFSFAGNFDVDPKIDKSEVLIAARMEASVGVGLSGLFEASVFGGITGLLEIDLANGDIQPGRVYLDELIEHASCFIELHGSLDAELGWSVWVGLDTPFFTVTVFEDSDIFFGGRLAEFVHSCEYEFPRLASLDATTGELLLHTGTNAGERQAQQYLPTDADSPVKPEEGVDYSVYQEYSQGQDGFEEDFGNTVRDEDASARYSIYEAIAEDGSIHPLGAKIIVVESGGYREEYLRSEVMTINGNTGNAGDVILVNLSNEPDEAAGEHAIDVNLTGGNGNDQLRVDNYAGQVTLLGGGGRDVLVGSEFVDDYIDGGAGDDQIAGFGGNDVLVGGAGNDVIDGGAGDDVIWGYLFDQLEATLPDGVDDEDKIRGGTDSDTIYAGPDIDNIFWQWGDGTDAQVVGDPHPGLSADSLAFDTLHIQTYAVSGRGSNEVKSEEGEDIVTMRSTAAPSTYSGEIDLARGGDASTISFSNIASVSLDVGDFGDTVNIGDLSNTGIRALTIDNGGDSTYDWDEDDNLSGSIRTPDSAVDNISINLGDTADTLLVSSNPDKVFTDSYFYEARWLEQDLKFVVKSADLDLSDTLSIYGGTGNDTIDAEEVVTQAMQLTLDGQAGDDRIYGSDLSEELIGGFGSDIISGRGGVDIFSDDQSTHRMQDIDTLYEVRDADFSLTNQSLTISNDIDASDVFAVDGRIDINTEEFNVYLDVAEAQRFTETENISYNAGANAIFERVHFVGGLEANRFFINEFGGRLGETDNAQISGLGDYTVYLDGGVEADVYRIWNYAEHPEFPDSETRLLIDDTGATIIGEDEIAVDQTRKNDRLIVQGTGPTLENPGATDGGNVFHFDTEVIAGSEWGTISRLDDPDNILAQQFGVLGQDDFDTSIRERDASTVVEGQHVYYSDQLETVSIYGSSVDDDLFIADDNIASFYVYGEGGEDRFFIGSVTESGVFPDDKWGMVEYAVELTDGVSYESYFFGGQGNDYFEVNHNAAEIWLYGEEGNDTFFLKAHLAKEGNVSQQTASELANISSSNEDEEPVGEEVETNLVFVKNAPVNIIGGGGYDTLAVAGTAIDDTFWVFVDASGKQRIYGSGLVVDNIQSIERLMLNTGKGDDKVYVYSTLEGQELIIATGEHDDLIQFGGPDQLIDFPVPSYVRTETLIEPDYQVDPRLTLVEQAHYEFVPKAGFNGWLDAFSWNIREPLPAAYEQEMAKIRSLFFFSLDLSFFYDINFYPDDFRPTDAVSIDGLKAVTYQYEIPEIQRSGVLLEQADLSQIRGTVKIDVGPGNDELEINAYGADGELANGSIDRMPVELVNLSEDQWLASSLANAQIDGNVFVDVNGIAAVDYDILAPEVASQLARDNQIVNVGLLSSMQQNQGGQTDLELVDGVHINHFGNDVGSATLNEAEIYAELSAYLLAHAYESTGPVALSNRDARIETYYAYADGQIDPSDKIYATKILDFAGEVSHVFVYRPGDGSQADTPLNLPELIGENAEQNFENWLNANNYHRNVKAEIYHELQNGEPVFNTRHYVFTSYDNSGDISSIDVYEVQNGQIADTPILNAVGDNSQADLAAFLTSENLVLDIEGSNTNPDAPPLPILYQTELSGRVSEVYVIETRTREGDLLFIDMYALESLSLTIDNTFIRPDAQLDIQYEYWDAVRGFGSEAGVYFTNMGNDGSDLVQINLGEANNHVSVNYSAENVTTEINLGDGNDTVDVFGGSGEVVINAGGGVNTYNIGTNERSAIDLGQEPMTNPDSTLPDPGYIHYESATSLVRIEGGSGIDVVNINDSARGNGSRLEVDVVNINRQTLDAVTLPDWINNHVENRSETIEVTQTISKELAEETYQLVAVEQLRTFRLSAEDSETGERTLLDEVSTSAPIEHVFASHEELLAYINDESNWQRQITENSETGILTLTFHEFVSVTEVINENYISVTGMGARNAHVNINYDNVEGLNLLTGSGDDAVRIGATAENMLTQVMTGAGKDQIHVYHNRDLSIEEDRFGKNHSRTLDNIISPLIINAGSGDNSLVISDESDVNDDTVNINDEDYSFETLIELDSDGTRDAYLNISDYFSYISTNDNGGETRIHYDASEGGFGDKLQFRTGAGDDSIFVQNIFGNAHTEVFAGAGHDDIVVASAEEGFNSEGREPRLSLYGQYGNDVIDARFSPIGVNAYGEEGDDSVFGSEFADYLADEARRNPLNNLSGDDLYVGNGGDDVIDTRFGADIVFGDSGGVFAANGKTLTMRDKGSIVEVRSVNSDSAGDDEIYLGTGDALAFGGAGNDYIEIASDKFSRNIAFGDNGVASVSGIASGQFSLRSADSRIDASDGNDTFNGEGEGIVLFGGLGNDVMRTGSGSDIIFGDNGSVTFNNNRVEEILASEVVLGGDDTITTGAGDDRAIGGLGKDVITSGKGADALIGDLGRISLRNGKLFQVGTTQEYIGEVDVLTGGEDENVMFGGGGNDELIGNFKQDAMLGYFGRITYAESASGSNEIKYMITLGQGYQDILGMAFSSLYTVAQDAGFASEPQQDTSYRLNKFAYSTKNVELFDQDKLLSSNGESFIPVLDTTQTSTSRFPRVEWISIDFLPEKFKLNKSLLIKAYNELIKEILGIDTFDGGDEKIEVDEQPSKSELQKESRAENTPWKTASLALVAAKAHADRNVREKSIDDLDEKSRRRRFVKWGS